MSSTTEIVTTNERGVKESVLVPLSADYGRRLAFELRKYESSCAAEREVQERFKKGEATHDEAFAITNQKLEGHAACIDAMEWVLAHIAVRK